MPPRLSARALCLAAALAVPLVVSSCGSSAFAPDAGPAGDAGPGDAGQPDASADAGPDAGPGADAGSADAGDAGGADAGDAGSADAGEASDAGSVDAGDGGSGGGVDAGLGYAGGFDPQEGYGGFGGGDCTASRTPIVFLHGNSDDASVWSKPASTGGPSVIAALAAAGYRPCELFGVTWLSASEQLTPLEIFHDEARAELVRGFLNDVRAYTGFSQVDIVAHSMGVTVALHALEGDGQDAGLRRFLGIAGGMQGLASCLAVGPADPLSPTCGAQSLADSNTFGFYPSSNPRMEAGGFRDRPSSSSATYYSIRAGSSDEILCPSCDSALFDTATNVISQVDVGQGTPTVDGDDDSSGVGHFRARSDSGALIVQMLTTTCQGADCCAGISGHCGL